MDFLENVAAASRETSRTDNAETALVPESNSDLSGNTTAPVIPDSAATADNKETDSKQPEPKPQDSTPSANSDSRQADLEKRLKDNQTAYHKEHQEVLKLRAEIEALKTAKAKGTDDDEWFGTDDEPKENPDGTEPVPAEPDNKIAELEKKISDIEQKEWQEKWNEAEKPVREKHADYAKIVDEFLSPEFEKRPDLQQRFQELGATPDAAYQLGSELYYLRHPDEFRAKILAETAPEPEPETLNKTTAASSDYLAANSKKPSGNNTGRIESREQSLINSILR